MNAMGTTISASDPSITYFPTGAWTPNTSDGTVTTNNAGATAEFSFDGEFVQVFGIIPGGNNGLAHTDSTYALDGASPVEFEAKLSMQSMAPVRHVFFHSQGLMNESHSLVITTLSELILDSLVFGSGMEGSVIGHMPSATSVSGHTLSATSASGHTLSATSVSGHTLSATSIPNTTSSTSAGSTTGPVTPVAAIVVSIFAALLILTVGAFLFRHRYRRKKVSFLESNPDSTSISPYVHESSEVGVLSKRHTRSEARTQWPRDYDSFVSPDLGPAQDVNEQPSSNSIAWGSMPHSVSIASTVVGDRSETSFVSNKKDSLLISAALNRRSVVVSPGTTRELGSPPSWTILSPAPPSYISTNDF